MALGRITQSMMTRGLLDDLTKLTDRIGTSQRQISSGRQITKPSDDPLGTQRAIGLRSDVEATRQHTRNVEEALGWLETSDDAMADISNIINRVRELTVQGASDSLGPEQRAAIALEIDQLIDAAKQSGNATFQGNYIFAGTNTGVPPYQTGNDGYWGNAAPIARTIGPGVSVQVNTALDAVLGNTAGDNKLLDTLRNISAHLKSASTADKDLLRGDDLRYLSAAHDELNKARATVGATMARLDAAKSRLADVELTTTNLLANTESTDLAKAILELTNQQNVYQAALRSGAQIIQPSLLDFLR
jgi:flagellar hook-associated protein 3 FlgL